MIEIENRNKFPVQVMVRSRKKPKDFTCLNIPGIGSGKNVFMLEDERVTDELERAARDGGIVTIKRVPNKLRKGE